MTQDQKANVVALLQPFWDLDIDKRLAETYKDYTDLSSIQVGYYNVSEFSIYAKRMISQLGQVLETPFASILPFQYQFQNDFGNGNLLDDLTNFNASILTNDFVTSVNILTRLVYYQVANGFWDKLVEKNETKKLKKLDEMESKLGLLVEVISANATSNKALLVSLQTEKDSLEQLVTAKKKELGEIEALLPSARNNSEEVNKLLLTSTATNESINGLLTQQNAKLDEITKKYVVEKDSYILFEQEIKELKELFNAEIKSGAKKNADFDVLLASVNERSSLFDSRIGVLNELIGKEGAERLFNTFNDRKNDLERPIKLWAGIVFGTGLIAFFLIIGIFTNFKGWFGEIPAEIDWHYLLINSIKSLPIMIVLLFTIKQYVRERTFQEEYAFRSAIALTVQAYGDIAGSKKEELIMKAISTIYSLPSAMKDKSSSFFGYRSKILSDTMKEFNETMKTFKPD